MLDSENPGQGRYDRGTRLTSPRHGALPLLLLERDVHWPELTSPLAVLHVSVVHPHSAVAMLPDCGHAQWHPSGGSSGAAAGPSQDHTRLMQLCSRLANGENASLPEGTEAFVGNPWLD